MSYNSLEERLKAIKNSKLIYLKMLKDANNEETIKIIKDKLEIIKEDEQECLNQIQGKH